MHLFITGLPRSGKTTLVKEIIKDLESVDGFYTEEITEGNTRVGFKIKTIRDKTEVVFAHHNFKTPYRVSSYYVDVEVFQKVVIPVLKKAIRNEEFVVIDEVGKMELFSAPFKEVVTEALKKRRTIITIPLKHSDPFIDRIKNEYRAFILKLDRNNFLQSLQTAKMFLCALSSSQLKELDKLAISLGLEEPLLIENASSNLCCHIEKLSLGREVLVVAGRGNNGADVLSCARKLLCRGYKVDIAVVSDKEVNQQVNFQCKVLERLGIDILYIKSLQDLERLKDTVKRKDFILEGLLGIGIRGNPTGILKETIEFINRSKRIIVSCDIPSGLSPDEGKVFDSVIKADYTITFLAPKIGFFLKGANSFCGKIIVTDIGVSKDLLEYGKAT